ncbi:LPXTG cell wall anchor domain-containing protein [Candidatus Saccharibacteria bacterium]|nr:LPXTG cell wall anchor domain-containing protein [Candidatus Saccharibacteria bacterium]
MSVEGQVLGAATVAGGGAGAVATLANTGNPIVIGLIAGLAMIVALGLITRAAHRR